MATIADLTYTDNMDDAKKPILTDLRESLDAIQTYINTLKDNFVQVTNDAYGSSYPVDGDGAKQFTADLYNKQSASDTYAGGDLTISTTGAWTDPDATNLALVFTPDYLAGDFKVTAQFALECVTTNATNAIDIRFRLTDGSTNSTPIAVHMVTGVTATTFTLPINISHEFASLSVAAKTVKLQYYITTQTATTVKLLCNASDTFQIYAEKV